MLVLMMMQLFQLRFKLTRSIGLVLISKLELFQELFRLRQLILQHNQWEFSKNQSMNQKQRQLLLPMPIHLQQRVNFDYLLSNNLLKIVMGLMLLQLLIHKGLLQKQMVQQGIMSRLQYLHMQLELHKLELLQLVVKEYCCSHCLMQLYMFLKPCKHWLMQLYKQQHHLE